MTERTVTEQQVIDVFNKPLPQDERVYLNAIFEKLFPELPAHNELVKVWNGKVEPEKYAAWRRFKKISASGTVITYFGSAGQENQWDNYRRQTPAERGEG
jgi:hypothetical protein